jgi:predicted RNase H-like HicB family nuclease
MMEPDMNFRIEIEQEEDSRWIAEVVDIPGVLVYGISREDAMLKAQALALRVLAERIDTGEVSSMPLTISFLAA